MDHEAYREERRVRREWPVTAPTPTPRQPPRQTPRKTSAGDVAMVAVAGVSGIIALVRIGLVLFGLVVVGFGIWGYQHAHTPEFKMECAAYKLGMYQMSFPDNALCSMFYSSSGN